MINVIYLVSRLKQSGPINQAFNIVTGMDKDKCNIIVVTLSPEQELTRMEMFKEAGIEVIQLNRKSGDICGCIGDLRRIIKEKSIDIVHSSGDRADLCNHLLRKRVKTVSTLRSEVANIAERKGWLTSWISQRIHIHNIRTVQAPVACSQFLANSIERSTGRKVSVIPNSVNTDYYKPAGDKAIAKNAIGLLPNSRVFLSLGSIIPRKNNEVLLRYFEKKTNTNDYLIVAGRGELLEKYKSRYNSPNIIFTGRIDALSYLQAADYLLSSSLSEGLPNTVLEALACGVPVILSDIGPHKEIMGMGNVGAVFDASNEASLDKAINECTSIEYNKLSALCREVALKHFSIQTTAANYYKLYNSLLETPKGL